MDAPTKSTVKADWRHSDGRRMDEGQWVTGEPNDFSEVEGICGTYNVNPQYNDNKCAENKPYICEFPCAVSHCASCWTNPTTECDTCLPGYTYNAAMKTCSFQSCMVHEFI